MSPARLHVFLNVPHHRICHQENIWPLWRVAGEPCLCRTQSCATCRGARRVSLLAVAPWLTAWLTRAGFVDGQLAALHLDILQLCNSSLGLTSVGHLHESKTAWPTRFTVGDEIDPPDI